MAVPRVQVVIIPTTGDPVILLGDPTCSKDPCPRHHRCHCMCPCMGGDGSNDCHECRALAN